MSEAMTNPEIEDVLASIRRLVAQDRKPRPERLILTEEFRVRQANLTAPPLYPALTPAPRPEVQAAVSHPPARPALAAAVAAVVRDATGDTTAPAPVAPEIVPAPLADTTTGFAPAPVMPAPYAGPEAVAAPASAWAPHVPHEFAPAAFAPPPVPAPEPVPEAVRFSEPVDLSRLEESIRELEAQIPPAAPRPAAQAEPQPTLQPTPQPDGRPAPQSEIMGDDVAFIDEDDLQILVARIVREELRGQLGERITQQVRKLVRAEISRALDERNLLT